MSHTKRGVKKDKDCSVTQPNLITDYNIGMGSVDVLDCLLGSYRPTTRNKKWYWLLLIKALNISIVAAWRIHCHVEVSKMNHLDFRREITLCLLKSLKVCKQNGRGIFLTFPLTSNLMGSVTS